MPLYRANGTFLLFIHIPKTGGTFIEMALEPYCIGLLNRKRADTAGILPCSPQHLHFDVLQRLLNLDRVDGSFAVVRNPISRIISEFRFRVTYGGEERDFNAWAQDIFKKMDKNPYTLDNHLRPQSEFVGPDTRIFHLEDGLEAVIQYLEGNLGVSLKTIDISRKMESSHRPVDVTALRDFLYEYYEADFERFGYD